MAGAENLALSSREILLSQFGGFRETIVLDQSRPNDLLIKTYEDATPLVEAARIYADEPPGKDFRHAAIIPRHVLDKAFREGWDKTDWKRWANDSSNAYLRTWKGQL